jgi:hypothetical protein
MDKTHGHGHAGEHGLTRVHRECLPCQFTYEQEKNTRAERINKYLNNRQLPAFIRESFITTSLELPFPPAQDSVVNYNVKP